MPVTGRAVAFFGHRLNGRAVVLYARHGRNPRELALPHIDRRLEARHSPTGFEWGYLGSGPAELARAILIAVYPGDATVRQSRCYQRFKSDIIGGLPHEGFTLRSDEVAAWRELFDASERLAAPR